MPTDREYKILLLTDSAANPRSFPASMMVKLEETYPYLLREAFKGSMFYQLSFGNITTEDLTSQATAYLTHWKPDIIIVQSGLADCRPEAFTNAQKAIINKLPGPFAILRKYVNQPTLIKRRQISRVSQQSFRKTLKKFKIVFSKSKIFWLEICAEPGYEEERPGILGKMAEYNAIIEEVYGLGFVRLQETILEAGGFNVDKTHFNATSHRIVADLLKAEIEGLASKAPAGTTQDRLPATNSV